MDCDHIHNKKVRLLLFEFKADGYWIWCCLVAEGYRTNGYYYDVNNRESLELFATDVCKMRVSVVDEVIAGCVRRGLFDKVVFDMFGILTSVHQQETYVKATKERRKKGTNIVMKQDYLLIAIPEFEGNITIIPKTKPIIPRTNGILPGTDAQSKVKNSRVVKSLKDQPIPPVVSVPDADAPAAQKSFKQWTEKDFGEILKQFTASHTKERLRAFFDYWREKSASGKMRLQLERTWDTKSRLETWQRNEEIFGKKQSSQKPEVKIDDYLEQRRKDEERLQAKLG